VPTGTTSDRDDSTSPSALRQVIESVVILAVSVSLFRTFAAEGYLISTGSMAPSLLGYHKQVTCPSCEYVFARGVPVDESEDGLSARADRVDIVTEGDFLEQQEAVCRCPNCGRAGISLAEIPRNEGDQLLVHKNIYDLRDPHRWEVVVFRNPDDPTQPYVKRVVGLPGETIRLHEGNVYADDVLQRKPLGAQQGIRIAVDDHDHEPGDEPVWHPRWSPKSDRTAWTSKAGTFEYRPETDTTGPFDWVEYRHWTREGQGRRTDVTLAALPAPLPAAVLGAVTHDPSTSVLAVQGAMSIETRDALLELSEEPNYRGAVEKLFEKSHIAAITDQYGYNRPDAAQSEFPVAELMVECDLASTSSGTFVLEMTADWHQFTCEFHLGSKEVFLTVDGAAEPHRTGALPVPKEKAPHHIEMSCMDRQVLLAVDGKVVFAPLLYAEPSAKRPGSNESPVRFAASGGEVALSRLHLYRDVYYTPKNASDSREFVLGPTQFLVLGDNSPISVDSRAWDQPAIDRSTLIGKPFVVHLPSRQARWEIGGDAHYIRVPDFSRIRYIR
jgi:signal peptidase I